MAKTRGDSGLWIILRPWYERHMQTWYRPLIDDEEYPLAITAGSVRQATRGLMRPRNLTATPSEQMREVKEAARRLLRNKPTIDGDDGNTYHVMFVASEVLFLWDETRPLIVHERRTNFWDDRPPTTETILGRPLRGFTLPDGMYRSWDLHPDSFSRFEHGCVWFKCSTEH